MELFLIYYLAKYSWPWPAFKFSERLSIWYQKLGISSINPVCINQEESLSDDWRVNHDKSRGYGNISRNFGKKIWPKFGTSFVQNNATKLKKKDTCTRLDVGFSTLEHIAETFTIVKWNFLWDSHLVGCDTRMVDGYWMCTEACWLHLHGNPQTWKYINIAIKTLMYLQWLLLACILPFCRFHWNVNWKSSLQRPKKYDKNVHSLLYHLFCDKIVRELLIQLSLE